jgi:hypothetical protein
VNFYVMGFALFNLTFNKTTASFNIHSAVIESSQVISSWTLLHPVLHIAQCILRRLSYFSSVWSFLSHTGFTVLAISTITGQLLPNTIGSH